MYGNKENNIKMYFSLFEKCGVIIKINIERL